MFPGTHAQTTPDKPAQIMAGSGETTTYRQLDDGSNRLAQLWWQHGLRPGDHVALMAENHPRYLEVYWAAIRSGLYFTTVNSHLSADEAGYVVDDCGARSMIASRALGEVAEAMVAHTPNVELRMALDGGVDGYDDYDAVVDVLPAEPLAEQPRGESMLYSSGTTGQPKGIKRPLSGEAVDTPPADTAMLSLLFGMDDHSVYLSPAPLYHAAPLAFCAGMQILGGTAVVMETFDAAAALEGIELWSVTHSQWVPTMFVRMLKLPEEVRERYDLSSHQRAIHAAAPCPIEVKRRMIDWWGPILQEYYAGTEGNGATHISSEEWLEHPGSVGRPILGTIHICDDGGSELAVGEGGIVYFERDEMPFEYHRDPDKTRDAQHPDHPTWSTLGDVGHVDEDGYLYLTDRKAHMIISGGVNIYPQETEDCLIMHDKVADVAVFGLPDPEMGEFVQAVVQPADGVAPSPELEQELINYARDHVAHYKVPRVIDFRPELPRLPTGKLYKRLLRDEYLAGSTTSRS